MGDTLAGRVGHVIAASVHALLDSLEDAAPETMMAEALRQVDKVVDEVRHELGVAAANRHLAQQQHAELNRRHAELGANIEAALGQAREDLARAAVARQLDIEAQLPVLETTLGDLSRHEAELKGYVNALAAKRRDMTDALGAYRTSRARTASAAGPVPEASRSRARMDEAAAAFDDVFRRQTGLTGAGLGDSLDEAARLKELDDMVRNSKIEERLAQVKAQQT
jgi:phage shock protein A